MTKIEALKKTIYNLENDVYEYDWNKVDTCNCGVLARTLLGGRLASQCGQHISPLRGGKGVFSASAYCLTTNLPLPEVFQVLKDAGFTHKELFELEYLNNEKISLAIPNTVINYHYLATSDLSDLAYNKKNNVISYLKAWVEILKQETQKSEQPQYPDLTKSLAVLPINETIDLKKELSIQGT